MLNKEEEEENITFISGFELSFKFQGEGAAEGGGGGAYRTKIRVVFGSNLGSL
jgi:hypothetical protein